MRVRIPSGMLSLLHPQQGDLVNDDDLADLLKRSLVEEADRMEREREREKERQLRDMSEGKDVT